MNFQVLLSDIYEYVEGIRPLKEGENVFNAGFIILCGVEPEDTTAVKALCLRTSHLDQPPHEILINFNACLNSRWMAHCSCKAGQSGCCKHIIATLIYINRFMKLIYPISVKTICYYLQIS